MSDSDKYWADGESSEVAKAVLERVKRYRESLRVTGRLDKMRRAWLCFQGYGADGSGDASQLQPGGESGEMLRVTPNQFAGLVNQAVVLTTSNKPATKAIAKNSDSESLAAAQFAEALNQHYERELSIEEDEQEAVVMMVLLSEGHVVESWDATAGEVYMTREDGSPVREGDVKTFSLSPLDVAYDPDVMDFKDATWMAFRRPVPRWDLAAQFPDKKDDILAARRDNYADDESTDFVARRRKRSSHVDSDQVYVWELRHLKTPALPNGRMLRFVNESTVLFDSRPTTAEGVKEFGYAYRDSLYWFPCRPEKVPGSPDSHTSFFDLLSMQQGVDLSASIIASAINSGGLQNLYVPRAANITADKLTGALNVIEYDGAEAPHAEDNVSINPAVSAWAEMCVGWMRGRVSMNDVVVGEPQKGMPAQAMALLRAQAVEFHSRLARAYEKLIARTRTGILLLLQQYATTERKILIAGKSRAWAESSFTSERLSPVARFEVEPVPASLKTLAGRVGFAQPLLDQGKLDLREYLALVETGRWEPTFGYDDANNARIQQEIESLARGEVPPILATDTHWFDIKQCLAAMSSPGSRQNPAVVSAVTEYVTTKLMLWRQMDPALIMLQGGPPPPPTMPPTMPPGAMGPPPPREGASRGDAPEGADGPKLPEPPKNPITNTQDQTTNAQSQPPAAA